MDNEWLARYRAHNDALARRLTMEKPGDQTGAYVPAQDRTSATQRLSAHHEQLDGEIRDTQMAKLFVSRIHRVAAKVQDAALRIELYELADEIEERLSR